MEKHPYQGTERWNGWCPHNFIYLFLSKLSFSSLWFGHFSYFSPKLKSFLFGSLWFQFYCHFNPKMKSCHICLIKSCYFVLFLRDKMVISILGKNENKKVFKG
ncbi:hypothetical protein Hanom_Chr12g01091041 [Helianthus anomalus]